MHRSLRIFRWDRQASPPPLPSFEQEIISALANKDRGDGKFPTTYFDYAVFRGIRIESRYRKAGELNLMMRALDQLPPSYRVTSIFCDSKVGAYYEVEMATNHLDDMVEAVSMLAMIFHLLDSGHNGISATTPDGQCYACNPDWESE